jgi:hypothetical protein
MKRRIANTSKWNCRAIVVFRQSVQILAPKFHEKLARIGRATCYRITSHRNYGDLKAHTADCTEYTTPNTGDSKQCRSGQTTDQGARVPNRLDVSVRALAATAMSASMGNTVQLMQVQADPNMSLGSQVSQVSHTRRE